MFLHDPTWNFQLVDSCSKFEIFWSKFHLCTWNWLFGLHDKFVNFSINSTHICMKSGEHIQNISKVAFKISNCFKHFEFSGQNFTSAHEIGCLARITSLSVLVSAQLGFEWKAVIMYTTSQNGFLLMCSPWFIELKTSDRFKFGWVKLILSAFEASPSASG